MIATAELTTEDRLFVIGKDAPGDVSCALIAPTSLPL
jgi:hypothetical protein